MGVQGKAALARAHSKTLRAHRELTKVRQVLECVRASAALVLKQASWPNQNNFVPHPASYS
jgi:hypothetical protein